MGVVTLSIQVGAVRKETYEVLTQWRRGSRFLANVVLMHLLMQNHLSDMIYLTDGTKARLSDQGEEGLFKTSQRNATYRAIHHYGLPSDMMSTLNQRVIRDYHRKSQQIASGECRIPYYSGAMPIPFSKQAIHFHAHADGKCRSVYCFSLFLHEFYCVLGKQNAGYRYRLDRIIDEQAPYCDPSLFWDRQKGKWFLLLPLPVEVARPPVLPKLVCEVTLGKEIPIVARFGDKRVEIGNLEEFQYRRRQMQERVRRLQVDSRFSRGGHGRVQKLQALERCHRKEEMYVRDKLHQYSRALVGHCIRHGYGTVVLQREVTAQEKDRYWSQGELTRYIVQKCEAHGLRIGGQVDIQDEPMK